MTSPEDLAVVHNHQFVPALFWAAGGARLQVTYMKTNATRFLRLDGIINILSLTHFAIVYFINSRANF